MRLCLKETKPLFYWTTNFSLSSVRFMSVTGNVKIFSGNAHPALANHDGSI